MFKNQLEVKFSNDDNAKGIASQPIPASAPTPTAPQPPTPKTMYVTFNGEINADTVRQLINALDGATHQYEDVHLLFQSTGGTISDGIAFYNYLRAYPIGLTIYNVGGVSSIAVLMYIAAKTRKVSQHGSFMLHRSHTDLQRATVNKMASYAQYLAGLDALVEGILRQSTKLTDAKWAEVDQHDVYFTADEAVQYEIATEIGEWNPPKGTKIFFVG